MDVLGRGSREKLPSWSPLHGRSKWRAGLTTERSGLLPRELASKRPKAASNFAGMLDRYSRWGLMTPAEHAELKRMKRELMKANADDFADPLRSYAQGKARAVSAGTKHAHHRNTKRRAESAKKLRPLLHHEHMVRSGAIPHTACGGMRPKQYEKLLDKLFRGRKRRIEMGSSKQKKEFINMFHDMVRTVDKGKSLPLRAATPVKRGLTPQQQRIRTPLANPKSKPKRKKKKTGARPPLGKRAQKFKMSSAPNNKNKKRTISKLAKKSQSRKTAARKVRKSNRKSADKEEETARPEQEVADRVASRGTPFRQTAQIEDAFARQVSMTDGIDSDYERDYASDASDSRMNESLSDNGADGIGSDIDDDVEDNSNNNNDDVEDGYSSVSEGSASGNNGGDYDEDELSSQSSVREMDEADDVVGEMRSGYSNNGSVAEEGSHGYSSDEYVEDSFYMK